MDAVAVHWLSLSKRRIHAQWRTRSSLQSGDAACKVDHWHFDTLLAPLRATDCRHTIAYCARGICARRGPDEVRRIGLVDGAVHGQQSRDTQSQHCDGHVLDHHCWYECSTPLRWVITICWLVNCFPNNRLKEVKAFINTYEYPPTDVKVPRVTKSIQGHFAPLFGLICKRLDLEEDHARIGQVFMYASLRAVVSAAVRMNMIGPIEGQRIQASCYQLAQKIVSEHIDRPLEQLGQTCPLLDIIQGSHDTLYSRLFNTWSSKYFRDGPKKLLESWRRKSPGECMCVAGSSTISRNNTWLGAVLCNGVCLGEIYDSCHRCHGNKRFSRTVLFVMIRNQIQHHETTLSNTKWALHKLQEKSHLPKILPLAGTKFGSVLARLLWINMS